MKLATVNTESRAKAARHLRVLRCKASAPEVSPKAMDFLFFEMQSLGFRSEASSTAKGILYRKALRTVSNRSRRACADCFRSRLRRLGFASPPEVNSASNFGRILAANDPRILQFGLKLIY